jgi:hypothetical protein
MTALQRQKARAVRTRQVRGAGDSGAPGFGRLARFPLERAVGALTALGPVIFALNLLIQTRFDLEVAAILARNIPVSDFLQFSLLRLTISLTGLSSVLLGIRASRFFRSGRIFSAIVLTVLGLALLIPTIGAASYEPVMPVPLLLLVVYLGGLFYGGPGWPFFEGDTFRSIIPFTVVSSTVFGVLMSPLPSTALRYEGLPYVT